MTRKRTKAVLEKLIFSRQMLYLHGMLSEVENRKVHGRIEKEARKAGYCFMRKRWA